MEQPARTRSIYITDELWERLGALAQEITGGSTSQLIENILAAQVPHLEARLDSASAMVIVCPTCTS